MDSDRKTRQLEIQFYDKHFAALGEQGQTCLLIAFIETSFGSCLAPADDLSGLKVMLPVYRYKTKASKVAFLCANVSITSRL